VGKDAIQQFSPGLFHYISHLHIAVSGFIAATGLAVLFLVAYGVRRGELWVDTLGHLGLIYLATLIFVAGALLALRGIIAQHRGRGCPEGRTPRKGTEGCKHQQPCCAPSAARPPTAGSAPSAGRSPASTTLGICTSAPTATAH
jgi:hypothetical protein